ncbi:hypothetical protein [Leucobacter luti]|uniref:Uncharacterized protein n=1 Tax=Leucobacter luti TaxID=340320 RepID=A0A4R6S8I5_9MICO|nr:hypothetical protein [Leucobacter luti]MCW2288666.1 hypothetical protein [Leucobacter luti]QYM75410.1 hypothetical protein K1X41_12330 [Leucobacter luti]TCK45179.1 hypothetical protein EDF60_0404 [Leucobacter luti]TDP95704.1 hypothetical protein EDF62_0398 [Leucobacter luti]
MPARAWGTWRGSGQTLLALGAVVTFLILGLVGMHLHTDTPAPHLVQGAMNSASVSGSDASSTRTSGTDGVAAPAAGLPALADPAAHAMASDPDLARQGSISLELVTACMLALLITLVCAVRLLRLRRNLPRARQEPEIWRFVSAIPTRRRPLYLLFSISRT